MNLDMTKGSPLKLILKFLVPVLLGCLFQQLYNMVDTIIVGKGVGSDALAAVGATGTIVFFILGFMNGLTTGFTVLSSQRYGAGDYEGLRKSVGNAFVLGLIVTVIMTIASLLGMDWLLRIMQTPEDIFDMSKEYIVIICVGIIFTTLYNLTASILRAVGNSKVPLYFLILSALLNVVLDLFFIMVLSWGVAGAAIATVISQGVSGILCLVFLLTKVDILKLKKEHFKLDPIGAKIQLNIGIPMALQFSITAIGTMILQAALNLLGSTVVASYTAACKVEQLVTQAFQAMGMTMATYSAQNWGIHSTERIRKGQKTAMVLSCSYAVIIYFVVLAILPFMTSLFFDGDLTTVIGYVREYIQICGLLLYSTWYDFYLSKCSSGLWICIIPDTWRCRRACQQKCLCLHSSKSNELHRNLRSQCKCMGDCWNLLMDCVPVHYEGYSEGQGKRIAEKKQTFDKLGSLRMAFVKEYREVSYMIETAQKKERLLLVAVNTAEESRVRASLEELALLVDTAGGEAVGSIYQNLDHPISATYVGKGKIEEIRQLAAQLDADGIVCDDELTPAQMKNLEQELGFNVLDRTMVILDIFASRARSSEGKIQVELAQLRYRANRLTGMGQSMSRLGGGIGTRGPGESKLETDRRLIHQRIGQLKSELEQVKRTREVTRKRRNDTRIPVAAIVGYTNAGKSSLLNKLTGSEVLAEDKLFATLDPTTRLLSLGNDEPLLMTDTVGFIDKLPHHLIDAFRSTLEEAKHADLIIHVVDCSNPEHETQMQVVYQTLKELGVEGKPIFTLMNKQDLLSEEEKNLFERDMQADRTIEISVKDGTGLDELREVLLSFLRNRKKYVERLYGYDEMGKIQLLRKYGQIVTEEYRDDGVAVTGYVPNEYYNQIQ